MNETDSGNIASCSALTAHLQHLQENNNEVLNADIEAITELICLAPLIFEQIDDEARRNKFGQCIWNLTYARERLMQLRKI